FFDGDELRELLRSRIEKNLVYPPLARRRNIEGKVGCVLRIGGDGRLLQNNISHSSGSAILDRAALELFAGIFPLTEIRSDRTATVTISVEYRLK
ncbi:MAG: energy transducer TonB, partial [Treponema sp.]|nr:energy transducer TonB [Treponema sp.]